MTLTPEQLAQRRNGIGSSDVAAIAGLHPYRTPFGVWLEKTGQSDFAGNERTRYGHRVESAIARHVAEEYGFGDMVRGTQTYTHPDDARFMATPDYLVGDDGIIECKHVGLSVRSHWQSGPPDYVVAQVQWQMFVTGRRNALIGAAIAGDPPVAIPVRWDEHYANGLAEMAGSFWDLYIATGTTPPLDHSQATADYLAKTYPTERAPLLEADEQLEEIARQAKELSIRIRVDSAKLDGLKHSIQQRIGDAAGVQTMRGVITWKSQKGRVATKGVIDELAKRARLTPEALQKLQDKHRGKPPRVFSWPREWGKVTE